MRYLFAFSAIFLIISQGVLAKNDVDTGEVSLIQENLDFSKFSRDPVNKIFLKFCDDGLDHLTNERIASARPGESADICTIFHNEDTKELMVKTELNYGKLNDHGLVVCDILLSASAFSGMFSSDLVRNPIFGLSGGSNVLHTSRILVPRNIASGAYYFCLVYWTVANNTSMDPGQVFDILIHKSASIILNVGGDVYYFQWRDNFIRFLKDNIKNLLWVVIIVLGFLLLREIVPMMPKRHKK